MVGIFIFGNFVLAAAPGDVVINEIAAFEPAGYEWIEIYNTTDNEIDLTGWKFVEQFSETDQDGVSHKLNSFQNEMIIKSNEYAIIAQDAEKFLEKYEISSDIIIIDSSWGSLKEKGEKIILKDSDGNVVQNFTYFTCPEHSLERINPELDNYSVDNWEETEVETPGAKNSVYLISEDNNDNEDSEGNEEENENLEDEKEDNQEKIEELNESENGEENENNNSGNEFIDDHYDEIEGDYDQEQFDYSEDIIINEILPNPKGKDFAAEPNGEWIELFNTGDYDINLAGWQIDDLKDSGSKPFIIPKNTIIKGESFLVFYYEKTKIALNNNGDEVSLINPDGDLLDFVFYNEKALEGNSFARADDGVWNWTENLTPGKENIISEEKENKKIKENKNLKQNENKRYWSDDQNVLNSAEGKSKENPMEISITGAKKLLKGIWVKIKGAVSVQPNVLGKKIFYISGSGIQIYFFKEDFPDLEIGDYISIVGKMSEQSGEKKINIEEKEDIVFIESDKIPVPEIISTGDIDEDIVGSLVSVEGEVVKTSGNVFYIDDGTGEIKIYIRATTGIKKPKMKKGDRVNIVGIASRTFSGFRVLPRFQEDIILGSIAGAYILPSTGSNFVLCFILSLIFNCGVIFKEDIFKNVKI